MNSSVTIDVLYLHIATPVITSFHKKHTRKKQRAPPNLFQIESVVLPLILLEYIIDLISIVLLKSFLLQSQACRKLDL